MMVLEYIIITRVKTWQTDRIEIKAYTFWNNDEKENEKGTCIGITYGIANIPSKSWIILGIDNCCSYYGGGGMLKVLVCNYIPWSSSSTFLNWGNGLLKITNLLFYGCMSLSWIDLDYIAWALCCCKISSKTSWWNLKFPLSCKSWIMFFKWSHSFVAWSALLWKLQKRSAW